MVILEITAQPPRQESPEWAIKKQTVKPALCFPDMTAQF